MDRFNRNIFTSNKPSKWEYVADYALAIALGLCLCMLMLHGLDALFY